MQCGLSAAFEPTVLTAGSFIFKAGFLANNSFGRVRAASPPAAHKLLALMSAFTAMTGFTPMVLHYFSSYTIVRSDTCCAQDVVGGKDGRCHCCGPATATITTIALACAS